MYMPDKTDLKIREKAGGKYAAVLLAPGLLPGTPADTGGRMIERAVYALGDEPGLLQFDTSFLKKKGYKASRDVFGMLANRACD